MIEQILFNHIPVKNIPVAVEWYTKILGFKFIWHSQEERLAQLNLPSGQMLFLCETDAEERANFRHGQSLQGVIGFQTKEIDRLYHNLKQHHVKVEEIVDDGEGNKFLNFFDPDGNMFNVQCDA